MREDRALAGETRALVDRQVVGGAGEEPPYGLDLVGGLGQVGLDAEPGAARRLAGGGQELVRARGREARRNGHVEPPPGCALPPLGEGRVSPARLRRPASSSSAGASRSISTLPITIRSPLAAAASNARSVASACTVAKTAAVPVPAAASAPKNRAASRAACSGSANAASAG